MNLSLNDPKVIAAGVVVVVVIVAALAWSLIRRRRSADLRQKFGPEYEREVRLHGSERKAEARLAAREKRVEKLTLRDLDRAERDRFSQRWQFVQSHFVDSPREAVAEADELVASLMNARGYPVAEFDRRAEDISVDHPQVVENYRAAHAIAQRVGADGAAQEAAVTEDLRQAMIYYRSLFAELLQAPKMISRREVA